jgi:hypothetical protein
MTASCWGMPGVPGRIVVLGGMDATRTRLRSAEALDPREGRWHQLPPMAHARASSGVSCIGDRLYVVAGVLPASSWRTFLRAFVMASKPPQLHVCQMICTICILLKEARLSHGCCQLQLLVLCLT